MNTEEMLIKIKELKIPDKNYSINDSLGTDKYIFRKIYDDLRVKRYSSKDTL